MIIKCKKLISETTKEELEYSSWITLGKQYTVLALRVSLKRGILALIESDNGEPAYINMEGFEIMSGKMPKNWGFFQDNYFEYHYFLPKSWIYSEFFEELEDGKIRATELFKKEADIIYREEGLTKD